MFDRDEIREAVAEELRLKREREEAEKKAFEEDVMKRLEGTKGRF